MRVAAVAFVLLSALSNAYGEDWKSSKLNCSGALAPAGHPRATTLVGEGINDVVVYIPPGFKAKKIYCEIYDPAHGRKACSQGACPIASSARWIQDADGYKNLHWFVNSPSAVRPRALMLSADIVPEK